MLTPGSYRSGGCTVLLGLANDYPEPMSGPFYQTGTQFSPLNHPKPHSPGFTSLPPYSNQTTACLLRHFLCLPCSSGESNTKATRRLCPGFLSFFCLLIDPGRLCVPWEGGSSPRLKVIHFSHKSHCLCLVSCNSR